MTEQEEEASEDAHHPKIDLSKSLHEAGHETKDLGFEGLPDDGPIERKVEDIAEEDEGIDAQDRALESGQWLPRLPKER